MKFLVFPMPAHGHINPMLPLMRELVSRGDEVIVYLTREFEAVVRATGASVRPIPEALALPTSFVGGGEPALIKMMPLMYNMYARGMSESPRLAERAREEGADALVYDPLALWGRSVARMLGLPTALFHTTFATASPNLQRNFNKNRQRLPPLPAMLPLLRLKWSSWMLEARHGVPRLGLGGAYTLVEDLNLVPVPRSFQPDADYFDERYVFMGPSVQPRGERGDFPLERLEGKQVLCIALGTSPMNQQPAFYKACFEAFRDTPWEVVMACGGRVEPASLGPAPANFLVCKHVPQLEVLPHTRVFLTHGGMNSTMEGLWYGVPMAFFPQFGDQHFNASQVERLGMGITLTPEDALSPRVLRETVERLDTDPAYRTRLAAFQQELREAGGHQRAADALQQYVTSRQGTPRQTS